MEDIESSLKIFWGIICVWNSETCPWKWLIFLGKKSHDWPWKYNLKERWQVCWSCYYAPVNCHIQSSAIITWSNLSRYYTRHKYKSDFKFTTSIPYLILMGELWGVCCEDLGENGQHYTVEPLWKGQGCLIKVAKFGPFPCIILSKSCLFYPSWQAISFERPPFWVAFI